MATITPAAPLTVREVQVLTLAAHGLTDEQIARRLQLRPATVHSHMYRLRHKLGAANRAHAVALGLYLTLITLDQPARPAPAAVVGLDEHARLAEDSDSSRLWRELLDAGPVGAAPAVLAGLVGRSRPWVYYHLRDWTHAGWAQPLGRGRWRAVAPARVEHQRTG